MNKKKLLIGSLALGAGLVGIPRSSAKPTSGKPASNSTTYDSIDAYIEEQMHRWQKILSEAEIVEMGISLGSYAMGWESQVTGKSTIISHGGIVPDFGAYAALVPEKKKGIILLYNANHAMVKMTFDELGMGAAQRLAGEAPSKNLFGGAIWLMRSMALIPLLQVAGAVLTLRRLDRWHADRASQLTVACGDSTSCFHWYPIYWSHSRWSPC